MIEYIKENTLLLSPIWIKFYFAIGVLYLSKKASHSFWKDYQIWLKEKRTGERK